MNKNIYTVAGWNKELKCWEKSLSMATDAIEIAMKAALNASKFVAQMVMKDGEPTGICFYKDHVLDTHNA